MKQLLKGMSILALATFVGLLAVRVLAEETAVAASGAVKWEPIKVITNATNAPFGATLPFVKAAPNGQDVIVVYNRQMSGNITDNNPYYRVSSNNGKSWSAAAPIFTSAANSIQVHVDYSSNNVAHAVWIEDDNQVYYARQNQWPTGIKRLSADPNTNFDLVSVDFPRIVASGNSRLDVVWVQDDAGFVNIYHAYSTNNGNSWSQGKLILSGSNGTILDSRTPDLFVDDGMLYVVWAEQRAPASTNFDIKYVQSSNGGDAWSNPITISNVAADNSAERPQIIVDSGVRQVVYTDRQGGQLGQQFIRYTSCRNGCINSISNWKSAGSISGQKVGANNATPFVAVSTFANLGNCQLVAFHGTVDGLPDNNETIHSVSNCGGQSWSDRTALTSSNIRSLRPHMDTQRNWWAFLVFEQVIDGKSYIRFMRNEPRIFMPVIRK